MALFKLFIIAHLLGDFFFQPITLVEKKSQDIKGLLIHSIIYLLINILVLIIFGNILEILLFTLIIFGSHFLIDYLRIKLNNKFKKNSFSFWSFIGDQTLHIVLLIIISLVLKSDLNKIGEFIYNIPLIKNINIIKVINYTLSFLLVLTPTSVFIKHIFNYFFNKNDICVNNDSDNIGSIIGMLERIVILLLGILGLYESIALVLTAKSLARFSKLNNQEFAEKYLVGTLISLIIAIVALLIIK